MSSYCGTVHSNKEKGHLAAACNNVDENPDFVMRKRSLQRRVDICLGHPRRRCQDWVSKRCLRETPLGKWGGSLERLGTIRLWCRSAPCEGERGWRKVCKEEYWWDGNILDHHAVLKKLSKTDGQSLSQSCRSVELPIFQEWAALMSLPHPVKGWSSLWEACPPTDTVMMDFRAQQNQL